MVKEKPRPTVSIVGVGLIGGSMALALKQLGAVDRVVGVSSPQTVETALASGMIDEGGGYDKIPELVAEADLIVLATPVLRTIELIPTVARSVKAGAVITDVGSTKVEICHAARAAMLPGRVFIGGHPMAGSEGSGIGAADPLLFQNAIYVLTPDSDTPPETVAWLEGIVGILGAHVVVLEPALHDEIVAAVSHLPQLLAVSLMEMVGRRNATHPEHLVMAAGGFRDMTRIASSPFEMWRDILTTNREPISQVLSSMIDQLKDLNESLSSERSDRALADLFSSANSTRATIPKDTKGLIAPVFDLLVQCQDRPGVLASITRVLADAAINIRDIELLKVREGKQGAFRISVESVEDAEVATRLLTEAGHPTKRRQ